MSEWFARLNKKHLCAPILDLQLEWVIDFLAWLSFFVSTVWSFFFNSMAQEVESLDSMSTIIVIIYMLKENVAPLK